MEYGYARISTPKQNIERQIRNIKAVCPAAVMVKEVFTGTKFYGRKEFDKLLKRLKAGDIVYFDSVSRMSRNADEGFCLYEELYQKGVELKFLKEPHIDTCVYRSALTNQIAMTGNDVDVILEGVNKYLMLVAKEQIRLAFEQAEKEVTDLRQRTKEGLLTAKLNGKQVGSIPGKPRNIPKAKPAKDTILKYSNEFGGLLGDKEVMALIPGGISHNTYYKYKRQLREEKEKQAGEGEMGT